MPDSQAFPPDSTSESSIALALGNLAIAFGRLEHSVAELVTAAFGRIDIASLEAVNSVVSFRQKLDLVGALAPGRLQDAGELEEVHTCIRTLGRFEERRNSLLHAFWSAAPLSASDGPTLLLHNKTRAHRTKGLLHRQQSVTAVEIQALSEEIEHFRRIFGGSGSLYHAASLLYKASKGRGEA